MSKPKSKIEISPKGIFVYPRLTGEPDTKFNSNGVYSVKLRLSAEVGQPLVDQIDAAIEAKYQEVKAAVAAGKITFKKKGEQVNKADEPYFVDDETGDIIFNFKMNASGKRQDGTEFTQTPALKDAKLKPLPAKICIGGGTEGKVAFTIDPFFKSNKVGVGVSLRLRAAQIIKLVEPSFNYGFEAEDGYEANDSDDEAQNDFSDENADTDDSEDVSGGDF